MTQTTSSRVEEFERLPFKEFTQNAYLNYSMYVILDRALPISVTDLNLSSAESYTP